MALLLLALFLFSFSFAQNNNRLVLGVEFMNYSKSSPDEVINLLENMYQKSLKYHNDMSVLYRMYQNSFSAEELAQIGDNLSRLSSSLDRLRELKEVYTTQGFSNTRHYFDTIYTVRDLQMTISNLERYSYPIPELSPQPYTFTQYDVDRVSKVRSFRRLLDFFIPRMYTLGFGAFLTDVLLDFAYVQDPNQILRRLMIYRKILEYKPFVQLPDFLFSPYSPIPEIINIPDTQFDCSLQCYAISECSSYCVSCLPRYVLDENGNLVYSPEYYFSYSRGWRGVAPHCRDYGELFQEFGGMTMPFMGPPFYTPGCESVEGGLLHIEDVQNIVLLRMLNLAMACLGVAYCNQYSHTGLSLGWALHFVNKAIDTYGLDSATAFHIAPLGQLSGSEVPQELYDLNVCSGVTFFHPGIIYPYTSFPSDLSTLPDQPTRGLWRSPANPYEVYLTLSYEYWTPTVCKRYIPFTFVPVDRCGGVGRLCYTLRGLPIPIENYGLIATTQSVVVTVPVTCEAFISPTFPDVDDFFPYLEREHISTHYRELLRRLRELVRQRQEVKKRYPHALPYLPAPTLDPQTYLSPDFLPPPDIALRPVPYITPEGTITYDLDLKPYLDALLKEELEHIIPYIDTVQRDNCKLQEDILNYNLEDLFTLFRYSFIAFSLMFGFLSGALGGYGIFNLIRSLNLWRL